MLIPSIDFMGGRIVQLEQGERLALESRDIDGWFARFVRFPLVQVIDLDAATGAGENAELVRAACRALPCQVGGGIRTPARAAAILDAGAKRVIVGSALFDEAGVALDRARDFASAIGLEYLVAAVDGRAGRVVTHGWKRTLDVTPVEAVRSLEPFVGAFLYTHVDTEGLLSGLPQEPVLALRAATTRDLIVAGGIRHQSEIDWLDAIGVDAVVGMAIYRGLIET